MIIKTSSRPAFTLLELLIYVALVSVVTLGVTQVFVVLVRGQTKVDVRLEVTSNVRFALDKIQQDLLSASSVSLPAAAGDSSDELTLVTPEGTLNYCTVDGQIFRALDTPCDGDAEPLTSLTVVVDSLTFTRLENSNAVLPKTVVSVQTALTCSIRDPGPDSTYTLTKQLSTSLR